MILDSVAALLPGLLPASYRGITFELPDTSTQVGRRIAEHLFPGHDRAAYDDMGRRPEIVTVEGLIVGDDYVARAQSLRRAFAARGPATLIHPWLGVMTVLVEDVAEISFSAAELRVVRIYAAFKIVPAGAPGLVGRISNLVGDVANLYAAARGLMTSVSGIASAVRSLSLARSTRVFGAAASDALSAARLGREEIAVSTGPDFVRIVEDFSAAVVSARPAPTPAVSPAAGAAAPKAVETPRLLGLSIGLAERLAGASRVAPSAGDAALLVAAGMVSIGAACELAGVMSYPSRDEAMSVRDRLVDRIAVAGDGLDTLSGSPHEGPARICARALLSVQSSALSDINEAIGRLPSVQVIETASSVSAFLVAQHLYGDEPSLVEEGYEIILRRNRHRHPAALPAGRIEAAL